MTKKISLVTKADPIYGSAPGIQSICLRPLPHSFYSANYSLVATGEGLQRPCHFYRVERQGSGLRFSQTKRKERQTNPLKRRDAAPLQNCTGSRPRSNRNPRGSKTDPSVYTGLVHGLKRKVTAVNRELRPHFPSLPRSLKLKQFLQT